MDKNKIIEAAAKLVAKGAYDKAIKEYQKVLEADPKDVRILQKMGELFQKKNDNVQAAVYFTKVAESYGTDGFFLKAVALYKQVLKLDPSLMDVNIKLAELHQQLQLMGEAMGYYQIVANHYDKAGDAKRSLDVLKKMVELDPDNVPSRVKLADLYVREQMTGEAIGEFQRAAEHLKRQNRIDDYVRVAERISTLDPNNLALAKELAELYLQRNDQKRALAKLQVCFKADSRDIDTLRLLAVAFQGLGQSSKTISVYKELARAYEERGQGNDAEQVWKQVAQLDPNDPDVLARTSAGAAPPMPRGGSSDATVVGTVPRGTGAQPVQRAATGTQAALVPPAPPPVSTGNNPALKKPEGNIAKLLTETDVYVKYGLHDKALEHLRKIFSSDPENIDAHEKAYAIYVASNNHAQAFEQLLNVLRLHTRRGDAQRAQPYLTSILQQNPGHPEVPAFLAALRIAGAQAVPGAGEVAEGAAEGGELAEDAILVDSSEDEVIVADEPADVISGELSAPVDEGEVVPEDDAMVLDPADADAAAAMEVEPPPVADDFEAPRTSVMPRTGAHQAFAGAAQLGDGDENEPATGEHAAFVPPAYDEEPRTDGAAMSLQALRAIQNQPTAGRGIPQKTQPQFGETVPRDLAPVDMPADAPMDLGEDEHNVPTRVGAIDRQMLKTVTGLRSPVVPKPQPIPPLEDEPIASPAYEDQAESAAVVEDEAVYAGDASEDGEAIVTSGTDEEAVQLPPDEAAQDESTGEAAVIDEPEYQQPLTQEAGQADGFTDGFAESADGTAEPQYDTPTEDPAPVSNEVGSESSAAFYASQQPLAEEAGGAPAYEASQEAAAGAVEEAVEAPPAEEPASEECDEATFFIEQGLYDEAREILETVAIAYPDHQRAAQLMAQLEQLAAGGAPAEAGAGGENAAPPAEGAQSAEGARDAFDLAQELANELGDAGESAPAEAPSNDEYQVSVEEVFSEFKKGLEKVVKPEDVDTHYDLGIAYKEMGLMDDAISEFDVARKGCVGKRKEVDCLTMMGLMQVMKGDFTGAIDSFLQALASEHATGDVEKAARFELATAYEAAGQNGKALSQFMKVQAIDSAYRDVNACVDRLAAIATPEDDGAGSDTPPEPPAPKGPGRGPGGAPPSAARKVGYV